LLEPQLEEYGGPEDEYDDILDDWRGEDGFIKRFRETDFYSGVPNWLFEFVGQINTAGLRLGYLEAGRAEKVRDDGDAEDSEVRQVIEEMTV
jgi:hypothetical protein